MTDAVRSLLGLSSSAPAALSYYHGTGDDDPKKKSGYSEAEVRRSVRESVVQELDALFGDYSPEANARRAALMRSLQNVDPRTQGAYGQTRGGTALASTMLGRAADSVAREATRHPLVPARR